MDSSVFQPPERELLRHLEAGRRFLDEERLSEAVQHFGKILEHPRDYFQRLPGTGASFAGIKKITLDLIGNMTDKGRQAFELQYGATATRLLEDALRDGDFSEIASIARRYFHTQAGYRATYLVGITLLHRGEPLAAALKFRELQTWPAAWGPLEPGLSLAEACCWLQRNERGKARAVVEELLRRDPGVVESLQLSDANAPAVGGESNDVDKLLTLLAAELPVPPSLASDLDEWTMPGGNPCRTGKAKGGVPLLRRVWSIPHADKRLVDACLRWPDQEYRRANSPVLPSAQPIVVGDRVFMRGAETLTAIDFRSGKRLWEAPFHSSFADDGTLSAARRGPDAVAASVRMWFDQTYGTISSDGERVFAVEDIAVEAMHGSRRFVGGRIMPAMIGGVPQNGSADSCNRLAAYDVTTGRIAWHVGGPEEPLHLPLSGTFFLGPPVPCDNRLYVQGERDGQISIFALRASTGELLWQQPLVTTGAEGDYDVSRRTAGLSPSASDGILVCPTNSGAVVAVDASTHALRWGYLYAPPAQHAHFRRFNVPNPIVARTRFGLSWVDSNPIIVGGNVLVTPSDSNEIHCLGLLDGRLLWKAPAEEAFFIATVADGNVVLVGANGVRALRLEDGKAGWNDRVLPLPEGTTAGGRGFVSDGKYVLPLVHGAVFCFDAATGENPETVFSPTGALPGNLVCHKGRVLSQTPTGLTLFYQRDFLQGYLEKMLPERPDDPTLLTLRGEMAVANGDTATALDAFRRAYKVRPNEQTRSRLWRILYDRLVSQSDAPPELWREADALSTTSSRRIAMMRLRARRARDAGDLVTAIPVYLELLSLPESSGALIHVDRTRKLRVDRMIKQDVAELHETDPRGYAEHIAPLVAQQADAALESGRLRLIESLFRCFSHIPRAGDLETRLLNSYRESGDLVRAEGILLKRAASDDPAVAAAATAELAVLLHGVERFDDAAVCYRDLAVKWPDTPCREGKTGLEFVKAVPSSDPVWRSIRSDLAWPAGEIRVSKTAGVALPVDPPSMALRLIGSALPFARYKSYRLDNRSLELQELDGCGRLTWKLSLAENDPELLAYRRGTGTLSIIGHRAYLVVNDVLHAIDMFDPKTPKVLWRRPLVGRLTPTAAIADSRSGASSVLGRDELALLQQAFGIAGSASPNDFVAATDQIAFRQDSAYAAADPFSGDLLWTNSANQTTGHFFGDNTILFAPDQDMQRRSRRVANAALQREPVHTLSAEDGRPVRSRMIPAVRDVIYMGNRALIRHADRQHLEVGVYDMVGERYLSPPRLCDVRTQVSHLGRQVAGVLEPSGAFHLLSLEDGKFLASHQFKIDSSVRSFVFFEDKFGYYVIPTSSKRVSTTVIRSNVPGYRSQLIHSGYVYALTREGKLRWPEPVKITNECFLTDQPANLPVLVFASNSTTRNRRRTAFSSVVQCIDKRTGMVVCAEEFPNRAQRLTVVADPVKRTVRIDLAPNSVLLEYTGSGEVKAVEEKRKVDSAPTVSALGRSLVYGIGETVFDVTDSFAESLDEYFPFMLPLYAVCR